MAEPADHVAWHQDRWVPMGEATVPITTHAFLYGTAVFEGIRAYWDPDDSRLYVWKLTEHCRRLERNARLLGFEDVPSSEDLAETILELLRRNDYQEDVYIRPVVYLPHTTVRVRPKDTKAAFLVFGFALGKYFESEGLSVTVSSWVRPQASTLPPLAKINGAYANSLLASMDAARAGYDEAIMLNARGYVSEGPAENLFLVIDGVLTTPTEADDILDGVTRRHILDLAEEMGIPTEVRAISRAELYAADEMFFCGTGVEIEPIASVDGRTVGTKVPGPVTARLHQAFRDSVRGRLESARPYRTRVG